MAATASPDTIDPPARLRSILEHRRAAGLAWSDVVFDRVVDEITRPLKPTVAEGGGGPAQRQRPYLVASGVCGKSGRAGPADELS